VRIDANDALTFFAGVFDGNPTGAPFGTPDPQRFDLSGTSFRVYDGAFAIFETRYNPNNSPKNGTYRLGAWYNSERFPSQKHSKQRGAAGEPVIEQNAAASRQRLQHLRALRSADQSGEGREG
jgi:porin